MFRWGPNCAAVSQGVPGRRKKETSVRGNVFEVGVEILLAVMLVQPLEDAQLVARSRLRAVRDLVLGCSVVRGSLV